MLGVAALVPGGALRPGRLFAVEVDPDGPSFLTPEELQTLRALVDRFIPGPPEDPDPGALQAGCAEAIDALLAAFEFDPPRIFAGGPFSDRAGSPVNHFEQFVPLDDYEARAWRLRIHGSGGDANLEFNGPVQGWQTTYREGLAALDDESGGFLATMPGPTRDLVINSGNDAIDRLVDIAFPHTLEFMYGPPEYGGNIGLVGWEFPNFDGDVQPRGWTAEQVENLDDPGPLAPSWSAAATCGPASASDPLVTWTRTTPATRSRPPACSGSQTRCWSPTPAGLRARPMTGWTAPGRVRWASWARRSAERPCTTTPRRPGSGGRISPA